MNSLQTYNEHKGKHLRNAYEMPNMKHIKRVDNRLQVLIVRLWQVQSGIWKWAQSYTTKYVEKMKVYSRTATLVLREC